MGGLEQELEEIKERLTEERRGRRDEEDKFRDMLRELQGMVSKERSDKESLAREVCTVVLYALKHIPD